MTTGRTAPLPRRHFRFKYRTNTKAPAVFWAGAFVFRASLFAAGKPGCRLWLLANLRGLVVQRGPPPGGGLVVQLGEDVSSLLGCRFGLLHGAGVRLGIRVVAYTRHLPRHFH